MTEPDLRKRLQKGNQLGRKQICTYCKNKIATNVDRIRHEDYWAQHNFSVTVCGVCLKKLALHVSRKANKDWIERLMLETI